MATLEIMWNRLHTYDLWSWSMPKVHQTAHIIRRLQHRVYIAHLGPRGTEPTQLIALKMARGAEELAELGREVGFYENELKYLQGSIVPRYLGFFRGKVDGLDVACMLMEYCSGPPVQDIHEFNRVVMLASCKIHQAGLVHGDLMDGRHFVRMGNSLRIVDFSTAVRHRCHNGVPILTQPNAGNVPSGCTELLNMERTYGIYSDGAAARRAAQVAQRFR